MKARWGATLAELREHLPYTLFAALVGVGLLGLVTFAADLTGRATLLPRASKDLFHILHFSHLFLSAMATTAMFWRYDRQWGKAVVIGVLGTILPCGMSDVVFPALGGRLIGIPMEFHICLVEHPWRVWPFLLTGVAAGLALPPVKQTTHFAHGAHVLLSSSASALYLVAFGVADWLRFAPAIFLLLVAAVFVPCCTSDIAFPLLLTRSSATTCRDPNRAL